MVVGRFCKVFKEKIGLLSSVSLSSTVVGTITIYFDLFIV